MSAESAKFTTPLQFRRRGVDWRAVSGTGRNVLFPVSVNQRGSAVKKHLAVKGQFVDGGARLSFVTLVPFCGKSTADGADERG